MWKLNRIFFVQTVAIHPFAGLGLAQLQCLGVVTLAFRIFAQRLECSLGEFSTYLILETRYYSIIGQDVSQFDAVLYASR